MKSHPSSKVHIVSAAYYVLFRQLQCRLHRRDERLVSGPRARRRSFGWGTDSGASNTPTPKC